MLGALFSPSTAFKLITHQSNANCRPFCSQRAWTSCPRAVSHSPDTPPYGNQVKPNSSPRLDLGSQLFRSSRSAFTAIRCA